MILFLVQLVELGSVLHITVQLGAKGTVQCILRQSDRSNHDGFDALPS